MMVKSTKSERIVLTMPQDLLAKLTKAAKEKGLSRAAYIRMVLSDDMRKAQGSKARR